MTNYIIINRPEFLEKILEGKPCPSYLFFPFWSWKVSKKLTDNYRCVGFHTGDLNEGQDGGSPVQNLIRTGVKSSYVNAILLNDKIDGGRVLLRKPVSLDGGLEEILLRISSVIGEMIDDIQKNYR